MDIKVNSVNFGCKTSSLQLRRSKCITNWFRSKVLHADTFTRTTFDVNRDLKKVRLKEKINEGRSAEVYSTNYDECVVRLAWGKKFRPKELKAADDPNGLILAEDEDGFVQLMKFVKGEPLYGKSWKILDTVSKKKYLKEFRKIKSLPDKTFAEYMREITKIRRNGYDIDDINPNNFILDGEHIGIVDLKKSEGVVPSLTVEDFNPLVNRFQLMRILKTMSPKEMHLFADEIKDFYDRIIGLALNHGYDLKMRKIDSNDIAYRMYLVNYLYYKDWAKIEELMDRE